MARLTTALLVAEKNNGAPLTPTLFISLQLVFTLPACPIVVLPCPALPCPALPCPVRIFVDVRW